MTFNYYIQPEREAQVDILGIVQRKMTKVRGLLYVNLITVNRAFHNEKRILTKGMSVNRE